MKGPNLLQPQQTVHAVVVPQEVGRERLGFVQSAVLGGDRLQLSTKVCVGGIARYSHCAVIPTATPRSLATSSAHDEIVTARFRGGVIEQSSSRMPS